MTSAQEPSLSSCISDDGDALTFCRICALSSACMAKGLDQVQALDLHVLVKHVGPFAPGEHLFREVGRVSRERLDQLAISLLAVCRAARVGPP